PAPEGSLEARLAEGAGAEDETSYAENDFVRRAAALLEHIGEAPRKITGTGALSRADCAAVLDRLGLKSSLRTMWGRPELAAPWVTLLDGGWLEITGNAVRRQAGPVPYAPLAAGGEGVAEFGH